MRIKLDPADVFFSEYIRRRDRRCQRCLNPGYGPKGITGLQASHYFGRGAENTRFDVSNVDSLCFGCHQIWGSRDKEGYRIFKIHQLGQKGFDVLYLRSNQYKKKDRKMSLIVAKELLKTL